MKNCNKVKIKNLKGLLNLIRVTKIDEILNIKANTNKKIEQTFKQFEKKNKRLQNLSYKNYSENLPSRNYCWGLILKAMKSNCA